MWIDITLPITRDSLAAAKSSENKALEGHIGTHFDAMNKPFPLDYAEREAVVFDVSVITDRDIESGDIDLDAVKAGMFVAFYTGFIERVDYGTSAYFSAHPQLAVSLIEALLDKGVSIIGIDAGGIRRGKEHTPTDQRCADRGTFVVENLCGLRALTQSGGCFTAYTFPMHIIGLTGIPCRVLAKTE